MYPITCLPACFISSLLFPYVRHSILKRNGWQTEWMRTRKRENTTTCLCLKIYISTHALGGNTHTERVHWNLNRLAACSLPANLNKPFPIRHGLSVVCGRLHARFIRRVHRTGTPKSPEGILHRHFPISPIHRPERGAPYDSEPTRVRTTPVLTYEQTHTDTLKHSTVHSVSLPWTCRTFVLCLQAYKIVVCACDCRG